MTFIQYPMEKITLKVGTAICTTSENFLAILLFSLLGVPCSSIVKILFDLSESFLCLSSNLLNKCMHIIRRNTINGVVSPNSSQTSINLK